MSISKNNVKLVLFLLLLFLNVDAGNKIGLDLINTSVGTWISTSDKSTDESGKDSYFNTFKISAYYHAGPIKGYIGIPARLSLEKYPHVLKYAFYLSDMSVYIGKRFGPVEPRLGVSFPLGYPTDNDIAWTGSGNVKGIAGLAFNIGKFGPRNISVGGEFMSRIYVTGLRQGARIEQGSFSWYLSVKGSMIVHKKIKAGIELFPHGSYFVATDWGEKEITSFGFLPVVFASFTPISRVELSVKGGYGISSSGSRIIHAVVSTTVYTW